LQLKGEKTGERRVGGEEAGKFEGKRTIVKLEFHLDNLSSGELATMMLLDRCLCPHMELTNSRALSI